MEQWARSNFQSERMQETAIMNAGALGELKILDALLDLTYEQLAEGLSDERSSERDEASTKHLGPKAGGGGDTGGTV
jgi:hypothetical protein